MPRGFPAAPPDLGTMARNCACIPSPLLLEQDRPPHRDKLWGGAPCLLGVVMGASGPQASTTLCTACFPACREGQFGRNCQETCQRAQGCRGLSFCLPDPYGCSCASGWSGSRCNQGTGMWVSATRPCVGVPAPMWDHRHTVAGDSSEDFSSHSLSPGILRP